MAAVHPSLAEIYDAACDATYELHLASFRPGEVLKTPSGEYCQGAYGRVLSLPGFPGKVIKVQSPRRVGNNEHLRSNLTAAAEKELQALWLFQTIPHIPQFYVAFSSPGRRYAIIMAQTSYDLFETFLNSKSPSSKQATLNQIESIAKKLLEALTGIHEMGFAHFDIKPKNCSEDSLFDFGFCEKAPVSGAQAESKYSDFYRPPEANCGLGCGTPGDIWALGCTLYQLATGRPFIPILDGTENRETRLKSATDRFYAYVDRLCLKQIPFGMWEKSPFLQSFCEADSQESCKLKPGPLARLRPFREQISQLPRFQNDKDRLCSLLDLLSKMLVFDPNDRITAEKALEHPFFTDRMSSDLSFQAQASLVEDAFTVKIFDPLNDEFLLQEIEFGPGLKPIHCCHIPKGDSYRIKIYARKSLLYEKIEAIKDRSIVSFSPSGFKVDLSKRICVEDEESKHP